MANSGNLTGVLGIAEEKLEAAEADAVRLREALASIGRYVSWCKHGEADRGTTLDKIDEIVSEALRA